MVAEAVGLSITFFWIRMRSRPLSRSSVARIQGFVVKWWVSFWTTQPMPLHIGPQITSAVSSKPRVWCPGLILKNSYLRSSERRVIRRSFGNKLRRISRQEEFVCYSSLTRYRKSFAGWLSFLINRWIRLKYWPLRLSSISAREYALWFLLSLVRQQRPSSARGVARHLVGSGTSQAFSST